MKRTMKKCFERLEFVKKKKFGTKMKLAVSGTLIQETPIL